MTNREYQKKQHRGSSPSRQIEMNWTSAPAGHPPTEEWKNLIWYPVSPALLNGAESRNTQPHDSIKKG